MSFQCQLPEGLFYGFPVWICQSLSRTFQSLAELVEFIIFKQSHSDRSHRNFFASRNVYLYIENFEFQFVEKLDPRLSCISHNNSFFDTDFKINYFVQGQAAFRKHSLHKLVNNNLSYKGKRTIPLYMFALVGLS